MKSMLLTVVMTVAITLSSFAFDGSPNYVGVGGGLYSPQSDDLENFDAGFAGEVFFGRRLTANFSVEAGVGYFSSTGPSGVYMGRMSDVDWTGQFEFSSIPVTATLYWSTRFSKAEFFAGAGAGICFTSIEAEMKAEGYPTQNIEADDTPLEAHLGVGGRYAVARKIDLGVRLQYAIIGAKFEKEIDDYNYSQDFRLDGISAVAGIYFGF